MMNNKNDIAEISTADNTSDKTDTADVESVSNISSISGRYGAIHILKEMESWVAEESYSLETIHEAFDEVKSEIASMDIENTDINESELQYKVSLLEQTILTVWHTDQGYEHIQTRISDLLEQLD